jgi:hypothetical protein
MIKHSKVLKGRNAWFNCMIWTASCSLIALVITVIMTIQDLSHFIYGGICFSLLLTLFVFANHKKKQIDNNEVNLDNKIERLIFKGLYHRIYLLGYKQWLAPRWLRRTLCKTQVHRFWLAGNIGSFRENDEKYGICDRLWHTNRHN